MTYASVVNGSYALRNGEWHYDLHGIGHGQPAFEGQPARSELPSWEMSAKG